MTFHFETWKCASLILQTLIIIFHKHLHVVFFIKLSLSFWSFWYLISDNFHEISLTNFNEYFTFQLQRSLDQMFALLEFVSVFGRLAAQLSLRGLRSGTNYVAAQFVAILCGRQSINCAGSAKDIYDI